MDTHSLASLAYVAALLAGNSLVFVLIVVCYATMYCSISNTNIHTCKTDATVAKRMALLVFTDFACWAPIAFFGLPAVSGYPLIGVSEAKFLLVFFYPLNSCANPYLYAILTKQYRRDLKSVISRFRGSTIKAELPARQKTRNPFRVVKFIRISSASQLSDTVDVSKRRNSNKLLQKVSTKRYVIPPDRKTSLPVVEEKTNVDTFSDHVRTDISHPLKKCLMNNSLSEKQHQILEKYIITNDKVTPTKTHEITAIMPEITNAYELQEINTDLNSLQIITHNAAESSL